MEQLVVEEDVAKVLELPIWIDENVKDVLDERSELVERLWLDELDWFKYGIRVVLNWADESHWLELDVDGVVTWAAERLWLELDISVDEATALEDVVGFYKKLE